MMKFCILLLTVLLFALPTSAEQMGHPNLVAFESTLNSVDSTADSTALLSGGETWTGTADDVGAFSEITVFVYSDVGSAVNGLEMEFSANGTDWDRSKDVTLVAGKSQAHTLVVVARYFRMVYTNGASAQSDFRLQVMYHTSKSKALTTSATQPIDDHDDVQLVRPSSTHELDVARQTLTDQLWVNKFGKNSDITTTEVVWNVGGEYPGFLQAAASIEVLSTDADDDSDGGGTNNGARTVKISGLDENWEMVTSDEVTLNGTSPVAVPGSWTRVNRAWVTTVGACSTATPSTTCTNEGEVVIRVASAGVTLASIEPGAGQTEMAVYTVPSGRSAYLREIAVTVATSANRTADVRLNQRRNVDVTSPFTARRIVWEEEDINGATVELFDFSVSFPEKTDIWFVGELAGSGTTAIDADFELLLVPNEALPAHP